MSNLQPKRHHTAELLTQDLFTTHE